MSGKEKNRNIIYSFSGKTQEEVQRSIAGPVGYICDEFRNGCTGKMKNYLHLQK